MRGEGGGGLHLLEQVFVEDGRGREAAEAVRHEDPSSLIVGLVLILPGLVAELAQDLVTHRFAGESALHHVVSQGALLLAAQVVVVHEP